VAKENDKPAILTKLRQGRLATVSLLAVGGLALLRKRK